MFLLLMALFVLVPLIEITLLIKLADQFGTWNTIGLMLIVSAVGAALARHEGFAVARRIQAALQRGELPSKELIDGVLILAAGLLMLTPGFATDFLALTVLFPPTRMLYRAVLIRRFKVQTITRIGGQRSPGSDHDVIDL